MAEKITKEMRISNILEKKPDAAGIMMQFGVHCIGCMAAHFESLEQGCKAHGMSDDKIDELVKRINGMERKSEK